MSSWIKRCVRLVYSTEIYWNTDFRSVSPRESETFLYVVKHRVVSLAAVFSLVTQRSSPQEERCVTRLKTAARETKHRVADREFNASSGWLEKFKTRHGIRNLSIQDEKLSADEETVEPFLQKLHEVIGKESDPQTNLQCRRDCTFLEVLTSKNSCFLSRKICSRNQKSKESCVLGWIGSTNATGTHKLKPVLYVAMRKMKARTRS